LSALYIFGFDSFPQVVKTYVDAGSTSYDKKRRNLTH